MCIKIWTSDPKVDYSMVPFWYADYLFLGDSNIHYFGNTIQDYMGVVVANVGQGGWTFNELIIQFPEVKLNDMKYDYSKIYAQCGGNFWTWFPLVYILDNYNFGKNYFENMIDLYVDITDVYHTTARRYIRMLKTIKEPSQIAIGSLPWVDPSLVIYDGIKLITLGPLKKLFKSVKINTVFEWSNLKMRSICIDEGVSYVDIFYPLKKVWDEGERFLIGGNRNWYDSLHYANKGRQAVCEQVQTAWISS